MAMRFFLISFSLFSLTLVYMLVWILHMIPPRDFPIFDFRTFYMSGAMLRHGVGSHLYDLSTQYVWQKKLFDGVARFGFQSYYNPPFAALLFIPFTFLPFTSAYLVFAGINMFLIILCLFFIFFHQYSEYKDFPLIFSLVFCLFFFPIIFALWMGQLSFIILTVLVGSWYLLKRQKPFLAGLLLSLLLIKPYFLLLPLALFVWKKQWRVVLGIISLSSILGIISFLLIGWQGSIVYIQLLLRIFPATAAYGMLPQREPTLIGFLHIITHTQTFAPVALAFLGGALILVFVGFFSWKGVLTFTDSKFDLQWGLLLLLVLLTSIHTNYYDVLFLLFPCLILLRQLSFFVRLFVGILIDVILLFLYMKSSLLVPFMLCIVGCFLFYLNRYDKKNTTKTR